MSRIRQRFEALNEQGRKALIPYITAGDPNLETTLGLMTALVASGADILELGIPFSDPSADGPVIQLAVERALRKNTSLRDVLTLVARFREQDSTTPVVLMGYLNPFERMGYREFARSAVEAGVDGVLVVDMPPEESHDFLDALADTTLDHIFLVAPTTREDRLERICSVSSGYLYYVSLKGVTGASHLNVESVREGLARLRGFSNLPVAVGFGIMDAASASAIAEAADGVVVGSALVKKIAELEDKTDYSQARLEERVTVISEMRRAMDAV